MHWKVNTSFCAFTVGGVGEVGREVGCLVVVGLGVGLGVGALLGELVGDWTVQNTSSSSNLAQIVSLIQPYTELIRV